PNLAFRISFLLYFLFFTGLVELITVTTPQKYVNVTKGGNVLLQCMFVSTEEETSSLTIQWEFDSSSAPAVGPEQCMRFSDTFQICYYQSGKVAITSSYEGRLQPPFSPEISKNASITLSNMQQSDAGVYSCDIHNFPDVEGRSQANIIVNVFEKPSVPFCSVHGNVETGHPVTLTCHSEHGSPKPAYTWTRADAAQATKTLMLPQVCNSVSPATPTGVLKFSNVSQFEFGEYQCNASNVLGFEACTVELNPELGAGVIAGAVIGAILGCVLIALVVWFIVHTVKKQKYKAVNVFLGSQSGVRVLPGVRKLS
uniref:V-set and immunoglobulin domain-containing protein 1 n=1 Tax=Gouania willdenowi TaxID=441366 RepID=A0A8C5HZW1_GOUWI